MKKPLYITTTLPYVNADPHVGFATEILQADVLARLARLNNREVFFNTGTDEHGQKVYEASQRAGEEVKSYVDRYADEVKKLKEALNLSTDAFIRTTDDNHVRSAQALWEKCKAKGDIEKKTFKGLYCVGCEKYLTQRDLVDGKCPLHPNLEPQEVEEENYFFKLSKYQEQLKAYVSKEGVIVPEHRRLEALDFVNNGLEDFSISRDKEKLPWGIPVPNDDSQTMYVWFDALTNYISTLGWPEDREGKFKKFWEEGETLQMAGKDQVRFQSIMWQAMLMSADIKPTDKIFYHGFINSGGQRMSKSTGNVISPYELVERYGTEATRFLLLRNIHPIDDTDVTWKKLDEWYTAQLVNGIGNLTSRILKLAETYLDEPVQLPHSDTLSSQHEVSFTNFRIDQFADQVILSVNNIDEKITTTEPFKVIKEDKERGLDLIREDILGLFEITKILEPFMPETSEKIKKAILENKKPENLFPRLG